MGRCMGGFLSRQMRIPFWCIFGSVCEQNFFCSVIACVSSLICSVNIFFDKHMESRRKFLNTQLCKNFVLLLQPRQFCLLVLPPYDPKTKTQGHFGARLYRVVQKTGPLCYVASNFRNTCLLYTSPSPRDRQKSRMPSSA